MMSASKIVDPAELREWFSTNQKFEWIVAEYWRKYGIEIGTGTVSNWRHQFSLPKRSVRDPALIPWAVRPEHRQNHIVQMLRTEARRRAGESIPADRLKKATNWVDRLHARKQVVNYDPAAGWSLVPREPGDVDIIRRPTAPTRRRGARD